jgi:cytochrome P450
LVLIPVLAIHRLPEIWGDDCDEFKPERFLSDAPAPFTYMPFLAGPRSCIGSRFATLEMEVLWR